MVSTQALEQATKASYQRALLAQNRTLAALGTDEFDDVLSDVIKATAQDELFPWVRMNTWLVPLDNADIIHWYVIKCLSSDAVQDMHLSATLETMQKESKIFARGSLSVADSTQTGFAYKKLPEIEFHNVKLKAGEELRLLLLSVIGQTTNGMTVQTDLEYRLQGV